MAMQKFMKKTRHGRRCDCFSADTGRDICNIIEAVGEEVDPARIGERVITDNWLGIRMSLKI